MKQVLLTKCPICGKNPGKPVKSLKNCCFQIESYACNACGTSFKVTNEVYFGCLTKNSVIV